MKIFLSGFASGISFAFVVYVARGWIASKLKSDLQRVEERLNPPK